MTQKKKSLLFKIRPVTGVPAVERIDDLYSMELLREVLRNNHFDDEDE